MEVNNLIKEIQNHERIIILRHQNPDGDALGSQFGLESFIKLNFKGKKVYSFGEDETEKNLNLFFPKAKMGKKLFFKDSLLIVVDTANKERISNKPYFNLVNKTIKIDHHPNNDKYGDINIVDLKAASTTELLIKLFTEKPKYKIDAKTAFYLYIGLITDTGRFMFPSVTGQTLLMASKVKSLLDEKKIRSFYQTMTTVPNNVVRLRSVIMKDHDLSGNVASFQAKKDFEKQFKVSYNTSAAQANTLLQSQEATYAVYSTWDAKNMLWKTSLRSKDKSVNDICEKFGGGGHSMACGVKLEKKKDFDKIVTMLKKR